MNLVDLIVASNLPPHLFQLPHNLSLPLLDHPFLLLSHGQSALDTRLQLMVLLLPDLHLMVDQENGLIALDVLTRLGGQLPLVPCHHQLQVVDLCGQQGQLLGLGQQLLLRTGLLLP